MIQIPNCLFHVAWAENKSLSDANPRSIRTEYNKNKQIDATIGMPLYTELI